MFSLQDSGALKEVRKRAKMFPSVLLVWVHTREYYPDWAHGYSAQHHTVSWRQDSSKFSRRSGYLGTRSSERPRSCQDDALTIILK